MPSTDNKASARLSRLASHLDGANRSLDRIGGSNEAAATQRQCYNFEPGRLLLDQVAIITGAGSGIGRAAAILFAHHGALVTVSDIDAGAAQATADHIHNSIGDRCIVVPGDVTAEEFPQKVVDATISAFGGKLHILVLNAGFTWDAVAHKMSPKQWQTMLDVHCTAPFRLVQAAAPYMRDAAKEEIATTGVAVPRCVLTVSSVSGMHGNAGQANYATAKAGVVGLTKALAKEWGRWNVRANALVFGHIATRLVGDKEKGASIQVGDDKVALGIPQADATSEMLRLTIALGRVGSADEAAGAMLLLASPYASYVTGHALEVTGGGWM